MKIETILDAMTVAQGDMFQWHALKQTTQYNHRKRQYHAFRDRLIRIDERNKMRIAQLQGELDLLNDWLQGIPFPEEERLMKEKDARIAELEANAYLHLPTED